MKRWLWYLAALVLVAFMGWLPFRGADLGRLQPVEVLRISTEGKKIVIQTDTQDAGTGETVRLALQHLKETTAGNVFLETADYLLVSQDAVRYLPELGQYLRPACTVCLEEGKADLTQVGAFLRIHEPTLTLHEYEISGKKLPKLITVEERMRLVS